MIIWGSGGDNLDLGEVKVDFCPICEKERKFHVYLNYRYSHLYYCRWVTKKQYHVACNVCSRGYELDANKIEASIKENPIPFSTRYGWSFLLGIAVVIILLANTG